MAGLGHLIKRFFGSLDPRPPSPADVSWAHANLLPGEITVWDAMSRPDRRHSIGVAREVQQRLGGGVDRPVLAAALLHDCGKSVSGLGTFARVAATVVISIAGRSRAVSWAEGDGVRGRLGRYADHPRLGRDLLMDAGSDPLTADWAAEHHLPPQSWTVPGSIGVVLAASDDD